MILKNSHITNLKQFVKDSYFMFSVELKNAIYSCLLYVIEYELDPQLDSTYIKLFSEVKDFSESVNLNHNIMVKEIILGNHTVAYVDHTPVCSGLGIGVSPVQMEVLGNIIKGAIIGASDYLSHIKK